MSAEGWAKPLIEALLVAAAVAIAGCGGGATDTTTTTRTVAIPRFALPSTAAGCGGARSAGGTAQRIPARVSSVGGQVAAVVNLCIAGHGPYPFVVDTGADSTIIDAGLAKRLGLAPVGKPEQVGGAGCRGTAQDVRIARWSLAGVPLGRDTATAAKTPNIGGAGEPAGTLGSEVLSRFGAVRIDFRAGQLVLPGPPRPVAAKEVIVTRPSAAPLPATLVHGRPQVVAPMRADLSPDAVTVSVQVRFGARGPFEFTPDTGASQSVLDSGTARRLRLTRTGTTYRQNTACTVADVPGVASGPWSLAGAPLRRGPIGTIALVLTTGVEGLLGADRMRDFGSVVFDYTGGRLVLGAG